MQILRWFLKHQGSIKGGKTKQVVLILQLDSDECYCG